MVDSRRFLIIDGYPRENREQFRQVGMRLAWELYRDMLLAYVPGARFDVWISSDADSPPAPEDLDSYAGMLWTGCNLTVYHHHDPRVRAHLALAQRAYEVGVPQFGTCWGIQVACVAAGGEVAANPRGREMGVGRKIRLTEAGRVHPMYAGKLPVFDGYVSHDDHVVRLPDGATLLASNDHSEVQAVEVRCGRGVFWGLQYHPEYDAHEVACLIVARAEKLTRAGFFRGPEDLAAYVDALEALHADPGARHLRWQLGIDDTLLSTALRQCEFVNWLDQLGLPAAGLPPAKRA